MSNTEKFRAAIRTLERLSAPEQEQEQEREKALPAAPEPPPRTLTPVEAYEAQRHTEGQAMLDAMQRQLGRQWATVPTVEGPAGDDR